MSATESAPSCPPGCGCKGTSKRTSLRYETGEIVEAFAEAVAIGNTQAAEGWARLAFARRDEAWANDPYHHTGFATPEGS